jgi:hypothetical protein
MNSRINSTLFAISIFAGMPLLAHAQLGNLMQQLQKMQPPAQGGTGNPQSQGATSGRSKGGLLPSDQWCNQQAGALGRMKVDTSLIASEFNVKEIDALQDQFLLAFKKEKINKTFPSARFFQASFETKKVRGIYDSFLAFPEPETLAALIQISRGQDQQERADALMALTFLHLQAPALSINKDRWFNLYQSALGVEHFTALVFRARMNAYGEYGPKNLGQALGDLVASGDLPKKYSESDGIRKEWDTQNYQLIHKSTAKDIYYNEPNMPFRQQWQGPAQIATQIEQAQNTYANELPNTRVGRMYAAASKINDESIEIGNNIIRKTQDGNQLVGQLESQKSLRESVPGGKQVFADVSPEIHAAQLRMIGKAGSLDDEQKKMLAQAQEKRLVAQGIISQSYAELLQMLTANMGGDIVKMAAPLPALTQANNALIQSCIISAKWEQAMRAKDVPKVESKKTEAAVADLSSKFKD